MKSVTNPRFRKLLKNLPKDIQNRVNETYSLWRGNPEHPSLQFKKLQGLENIYSVRITLHYRALGRTVDDTIIWFWIGSHNDYDQLISSLK